MLALIDRYVYMKYPWYADLPKPMDVLLSDRMLATLEREPPKFSLKHMCTYIHLLSQGQCLVGMSTAHLAPSFNPVESHRL